MENVYPMNERLNKAIKKALEGKKYKTQMISLATVRRINEEHGVGNEKRADRIPVTKENFCLLPDILKNFDIVEKGEDLFEDNVRKQSVVIRKHYSDGTIAVVNAVNEDSLEIKDMWVEKPTSPQP